MAKIVALFAAATPSATAMTSAMPTSQVQSLMRFPAVPITLYSDTDNVDTFHKREGRPAWAPAADSTKCCPCNPSDVNAFHHGAGPSRTARRGWGFSDDV